jgi:hypothetical protein
MIWVPVFLQPGHSRVLGYARVPGYGLRGGGKEGISVVQFVWYMSIKFKSHIQEHVFLTLDCYREVSVDKNTATRAQKLKKGRDGKKTGREPK